MTTQPSKPASIRPISLKKAKETIKALGADATTEELILNNIRIYNDRVKDYKAGIRTNLYLTYQLNVQITKQLDSLRKMKHTGADADDPFQKFMQGMSKGKRGGKE